MSDLATQMYVRRAIFSVDTSDKSRFNKEAICMFSHDAVNYESMNEHFMFLVLLFVLALSLTSCGGAESASLHKEITAEINGESTSIPVTLYEGLLHLHP